MDAKVLDNLRSDHAEKHDTELQEDGSKYDVYFCATDDEDYPCGVAQVIAALEAATAENQRLRATVRSADSLLDCTEFALEWFFEKFDDPKHFQCDCSEDGGYMEWDTNAYIHTERCSSGRDDSMGALKDQIGQWRQQARAALDGGPR